MLTAIIVIATLIGLNVLVGLIHPRTTSTLRFEYEDGYFEFPVSNEVAAKLNARAATFKRVSVNPPSTEGE